VYHSRRFAFGPNVSERTVLVPHICRS